jgi:hypothetical protein
VTQGIHASICSWGIFFVYIENAPGYVSRTLLRGIHEGSSNIREFLFGVCSVSQVKQERNGDNPAAQDRDAG